jgi:hypothetical protein
MNRNEPNIKVLELLLESASQDIAGKALAGASNRMVESYMIPGSMKASATAAGKILCENCQAINKVTSNFCQNCGIKIPK